MEVGPFPIFGLYFNPDVKSVIVELIHKRIVSLLRLLNIHN